MITVRLDSLGDIESETPAEVSLATFNFSCSKKPEHLTATPRLNLTLQIAVYPIANW